MPAQVNRSGSVSCTNAPSDTVITLGAVTVTPDEKSPHPASGTANAAAATAVAARLPGSRRRPAPVSASHLTRQSLGPGAGCGSRYGAASPRGEDLESNPERRGLALAALHFPPSRQARDAGYFRPLGGLRVSRVLPPARDWNAYC